MLWGSLPEGGVVQEGDRSGRLASRTRVSRRREGHRQTGGTATAGGAGWKGRGPSHAESQQHGLLLYGHPANIC